MRDAKVEQFLDKKGYKYTYTDDLRFDQISRDANPARWTAEVDVDRAVSIGIAVEVGYKMPAIVCCRTHTSLVALLTGRHRIEGCGLAKPPQETIASYIVEDVLDEFEIAKLPIALNVIEGRSPDHMMKLDQAAHLTLKFPDRSRKEIAQDLGLKVREIETHIQLVKAIERAEELGVAGDMRKLRDDSLRIAVASLRMNQVFKRAVETLAFTEMQGRAARGLIKDLEAATSEETAIAILDEIDRKHREEIERRRRQGRRPVATPAQRWRGKVKAAIGVYPETVELLELGSHAPDFLIDVEALAKDMRSQCNEVIERCADLRTQWEKKQHQSRKDGGEHSDRPSPSV